MLRSNPKKARKEYSHSNIDYVSAAQLKKQKHNNNKKPKRLREQFNRTVWLMFRAAYRSGYIREKLDRNAKNE